MVQRAGYRAVVNEGYGCGRRNAPAAKQIPIRKKTYEAKTTTTVDLSSGVLFVSPVLAYLCCVTYPMPLAIIAANTPIAKAVAA